jgi:hypothetical protein
MAIMLAGAIGGRLAFRNRVRVTLNAYEPKSVVLDTAGVMVTGHLSRTNWRWAVISKLALEPRRRHSRSQLCRSGRARRRNRVHPRQVF